MLPPINLIFKYLQQEATASVWLDHQQSRIDGKIKGFDEFMNLVIEDAVEVGEDGSQEKLGKMLLKGDNISMISSTEV